jgi:electron transfer flavoprotein beta subunit
MAFKIIVCAKQVPDTNEITIDPEKGTLRREGVPSILNHDDANALEEALRIKDTYKDVHITVITMGPPQAKDLLIEALAMGADEAILASDRALGGSDTWATSNALAAVIEKLGGKYDLLFAGRQAIDGDTAQVGPQLAEKLDIPQVTYVKEFEISKDMKTITVKRALEDGYELIKIKTPCMLTAIKELNTPRYMSISGIFDACKKDIPTWGAKELKVDVDKEVGLEASPTNVFRSFTPAPKGKGIMIEADTAKESAQKLLINLKGKHVV